MLLHIKEVLPAAGTPEFEKLQRYAPDIKAAEKASWTFQLIEALNQSVSLSAIIGVTIINTGLTAAWSVPVFIACAIAAFWLAKAYRHNLQMFVHEKTDKVDDALQRPWYYFAVCAIIFMFSTALAYKGGSDLASKYVNYKGTHKDTDGMQMQRDAQLSNATATHATLSASITQDYDTRIAATNTRYDAQAAQYKGQPERKADIAAIERRRAREINTLAAAKTADLRAAYDAHKAEVGTINAVYTTDKATAEAHNGKERSKEENSAGLSDKISLIFSLAMMILSSIMIYRATSLKTACGVKLVATIPDGGTFQSPVEAAGYAIKSVFAARARNIAVDIHNRLIVPAKEFTQPGAIKQDPSAQSTQSTGFTTIQETASTPAPPRPVVVTGFTAHNSVNPSQWQSLVAQRTQQMQVLFTQTHGFALSDADALKAAYHTDLERDADGRLTQTSITNLCKRINSAGKRALEYKAAGKDSLATENANKFMAGVYILADEGIYTEIKDGMPGGNPLSITFMKKQRA